MLNLLDTFERWLAEMQDPATQGCMTVTSAEVQVVRDSYADWRFLAVQLAEALEEIERDGTMRVSPRGTLRWRTRRTRAAIIARVALSKARDAGVLGGE